MKNEIAQMGPERKKEYMKSQLPELVNMITEPDKRKRGFYKCPLPGCGSGHGDGPEHDGAFSIAADKQHWKCY